MRNIIVFLAIIISTGTNAQPAIEWQNTIGGDTTDFFTSIQQTGDGGYILSGRSFSNISGDKTENSLGGWDYWVVKLDSSGAIQWQNTIGGNDEDILQSIQQTSDGGYVLGGYSLSDISGDKTENSIGGSYDYWVVKLDASGVIQWQNTIGGSLNDQLYSIQQTSDSGYVLGGYSNSNISGDKTENSQGSYDYWVVKLDASGVIQWQNTVGGSSADYLYSIQQTSDGGYVLVGYSTSNISGDKTENSQGSEDYWVVKLDTSGVIQWQNTIGGSGTDWQPSIWQCNDEGYILGGTSASGISGDKTDSSRGGYDYWVVKLDTAGVIQWQNTIGGSGDDWLRSTQQTSDGGYVLGGYSVSDISGDKTENSLGLNDQWVVKLDTSGAIQWQNTIGGSANDYILSSQQTNDGGYVLGGFSYSNISGDKTENSQGGADYWVVKLCGPDTTNTSPQSICAGDSALIFGIYQTIAGTYYDTLTNGKGCDSIIVKTLTVNALPTVTAAGTATICSGASTTLTATGASTYSWDNGAGTGSSVSVSPTATTTYTVTGTDGNSCTNTDQVTVTVNALPTVTASGTTTICSGDPTTLTASGAFTYSWDNGAGAGASVSVSPTATTTYTVTGTDGNGCTNTDQVVVTVNALPTVVATGTTSICTGASTTLTATGASTYLWDNGAGTGSSVSVSPTATTTYTVTGTDGNGCINTDQVIVTVNSLPTVTASGTATICTGASTSLTATGASTYSWDNGGGTGSSVSVSPTATTTYTVTGTDGNGCINTDQVTVTVNSLPTVTASGTTSICTGASTTLTATGASTYSWDNGAGTGASVSVSPTATTTYTVTGTDGNGCQNTDQVIVTVNSLPTVTASGTATICTGASTTLTASGASTYSWDNGGGTGSSVSVSPTATTTYTVTGTDGNGCTNTDQVIVTVNSLPTVTASGTATICSGASTTLTATGASTYLWDNGGGAGSSVSVSPTVTTTYTVTGTDGNGCQNTDQVTVTVNSLPTVTASGTATICTGASTTLTATGASTYSWDNGGGAGSSVSVSPTVTTTYTVTGTDGNGCTNTDQVIVTVNSLPTVTASGTATICSGASTTLTATGASTYSWDNGGGTGATVSVSPTVTTTYTVTGTDGNGCTNTDQVTITVNSATANAGTDVDICIGLSTNLLASGGVSYSWTPTTGLSNPNIANPVANPTTTTIYIVTVTAANTCMDDDTVVVTVNPLPTADAGADVAICNGSNTTLTASGGVTYSWSPTTGLSNANIANPTASPTATTSYIVTADNGGCTDADTVIVTVNSLPTVVATGVATTCSGDATTLTATGASTYSWDNGGGAGSSVSVSPTSTTTYTVTGTDGNGCQNTDQVIITVNPLPTVIAMGTASICTGASTTLTATGASTYSWDNGAGAGASVNVSPTATTTYNVTGTDGNGCVNTDQVLVTVNSLPAVAATGAITTCSGDTTTLAATGATTYSWDNGAGTGSSVDVSPTTTTTYTVTGTDGNGCINTDQVIVTVNALPTVTASGTASICTGESTPLTATGATSYSWDNGAGIGSSVSVSPTATTTYTVTGTDGNSCTNTDQVMVNVNPNPATPTVNPSGNNLVSSVAGTSYQWFFNGDTIAGATLQVHIATQSGFYSVTVIDGNGCSATSALVEVTVVGIEVESAGISIDVYPNPNRGVFTLEIQVEGVQDIEVTITNIVGQEVLLEKLTQIHGLYQKEIDLKGYSPGVYTLQVRTENGEVNKRIVVE